MKLRYTRRAAAQLDAVLAYINERSPQGAQHVMERLEAAMGLVVDHPRSGTLTGKRGLRRVVTSPYPYLIFYRATTEEVVIHGVRHAARRLPD